MIMSIEYHNLQRHLAGYLANTAKLQEEQSIAIMLMLKTQEQVLTMMDYIDKRREKPLDWEHLWQAATAISEQVK